MSTCSTDPINCFCLQTCFSIIYSLFVRHYGIFLLEFVPFIHTSAAINLSKGVSYGWESKPMIPTMYKNIFVVNDNMDFATLHPTTFSRGFPWSEEGSEPYFWLTVSTKSLVQLSPKLAPISQKYERIGDQILLRHGFFVFLKGTSCGGVNRVKSQNP